MRRTLLFLFAALFATASCEIEGGNEYSEEDIDGFMQEVFWDQTEVPEYTIISEGKFNYEEMAERYFGPDGDLDGEALDAKKEYLKGYEEMLKEDPDNAVLDKTYNIFSFSTRDHEGQMRKLSAIMLYDDEPENVIFCCPYTHTKEEECATESIGGYEALTFFQSGLFIMPDGQGFGADENHVQTYLNHELHAKQYYDALKVGQKIYEDRYGDLEDDWTLRIVGASQGAGDAIALHRFLDKNYKTLNLSKYYKTGRRDEANKICAEYNYPKGSPTIEVPLRDVHRFEYSYVCCGPYCPEETMRTFSEWKKIDYPCVIPLVIKSMLACDPVFAETYPEDAFFSGRWNEMKTQWTWGIAPLEELYLKKTLPSDELNEHICRVLGVARQTTPGPTVPLWEMLSDAMTKTDSPIYKDLMQRLREQDLTTGWKPRTPTKLHYCRDDNVVPYVNTQKLIQLFQSNNCTCKTVEYKAKSDKKHTAHVDCCEDYITSEWKW